jgi:serine/threonine protein kinase
MAGVYRAQHETGPVIAIKVLPPSKAKDPGLLARFQREARVALRLKHPNIVRTFQVGEAVQPGASEKLHYLVMEHLEGETLEDVLQRRRQFLPGEAVRLIHQALLGLQHIHEKGMVHRDIKPANLMLAYPPGTPFPAADTLKATVKILDMGLARTLSDELLADPERMEQVHLTSEGIVLGTPDYMAPEQARDARHADIRADIYSLGCVLYHLLDGRPPFPDTNIISQMIRHATETPKPLKEVNPAVPDGLQQIVNWMIAKDPAQRYPTPERAAQAMQMFLASGAEPGPTPEADPRMKKYLTWLELDTGEIERRKQALAPASTPTASPARPSSGAMPAARPAASPRPAEKPKGKAAAAARKRERRKARKSQANLGLPPADGAAAGVDVELVALPPARGAAAPPQKLFSLPLTRRDLFMFGIGISTVAVGAGLGLLGAWMSGAFSKAEEDPPPDGNNE